MLLIYYRFDKKYCLFKINSQEFANSKIKTVIYATIKKK